MEKYLSDEQISIDELKVAIRKATIHGTDDGLSIVPAFCGSAFKNKGVQQILDAVIDFLPSPIDLGDVEGFTENDEPSFESSLRMSLCLHLLLKLQLIHLLED